MSMSPEADDCFRLHQEVLTPDGPGLIWGQTPQGLLVIRFLEPLAGKRFNGWIGEYDVGDIEQVPIRSGKLRGKAP